MTEKPSLFLRILAPYGLGILVLPELYFAKLNLLIEYLTTTVIILLFIISYLYRSLKVYHHKQFLSAIIYLFFFLAGGLNYEAQNEEHCLDHFSLNKTNYISIFIIDEPQQKGKTLRCKARVTYAYLNGRRQAARGTVLLLLKSNPSAETAVKYGNSYLVPSKYQPVPPALNPGEFDFSAWLSRQNIRHQMFLFPEEMILLAEDKGSPIVSFALSLRKRGTTLFRRLIRDNEAYAIACTLILGYRSDLAAETLNSYTKTGTIHALSVSGMHVGIIYLVLEFSLRWMDKKRALKWVKTLLIIALIWGYTLLSGYAPSILRSAIMLSLFILAKALKKNPDGIHILSISAFGLLLYHPLFLWDIGFQLSYLSVFGLGYLQPKIEALYTFQNRWLQQVWGLVCLSLSAQLFTFPLSIYFFHQFPTYFILSNLFIALPVTVLMYLGVAILLLPLDCLGPAFEWLILAMNAGLEWITQLPYPLVNAIWISKTELVLLCILLCLTLTGLVYRSKTKLLLGIAFLLCLQSLLLIDQIAALKQRKIILFSLQKNYAAAFITGKTVVLVTDLKPSDQSYTLHIQPALDQLKIDKITFLGWKQALKRRSIWIKEHQLCFGKLRVLLVDSSFNYKHIQGQPRFEAVWLHGNPRINLQQLRQETRFNKLWIDASNAPYTISRYQQDTINFKGATVVLKKNKAYLIDLK